MKVLVQNWTKWVGQELISISIDQAQLDETIAQVHEECPEDGGIGAKVADVEVLWITIQDESTFAEMVKQDTVFLFDDERNIVFGSPEYQGR